MTGDLQLLEQQLRTRPYHGLEWDNRVFAGRNHYDVLPEAFGTGLERLYAGTVGRDRGSRRAAGSAIPPYSRFATTQRRVPRPSPASVHLGLGALVLLLVVALVVMFVPGALLLGRGGGVRRGAGRKGGT